METGSHSVALRIEVVADLHRVTRLLLIVVVVHRRLEQERVAALRAAHLLDAVLDGGHEHTRIPAIHCSPHATVHVDARLLRTSATPRSQSPSVKPVHVREQWFRPCSQGRTQRGQLGTWSKITP